MAAGRPREFLASPGLAFPRRIGHPALEGDGTLANPDPKEARLGREPRIHCRGFCVSPRVGPSWGGRKAAVIA